MGVALAVRLRIPACRDPSASISPAGTVGNRTNRSQGYYRFALSSLVERNGQTRGINDFDRERGWRKRKPDPRRTYCCSLLRTWGDRINIRRPRLPAI